MLCRVNWAGQHVWGLTAAGAGGSSKGAAAAEERCDEAGAGGQLATDAWRRGGACAGYVGPGSAQQ